MAPVGVDETPVGADETPVGADETPVGVDETPVGVDETPVGADETPVGAVPAAATAAAAVEGVRRGRGWVGARLGASCKPSLAAGAARDTASSSAEVRGEVSAPTGSTLRVGST